MALSERQAKFVESYLISLNATKAAIEAGYAEKYAGANADKLLKLTKVQVAIAEAIEKRKQRTEVTQDRVLLEIARLAFNDPRKAFNANGALLPIQEWPDEVAAAISSIKINEMRDAEGNTFGETKEIKFWDKGKQIELAGRHLAMFTDNLKHAGEIIQKIARIELIPLTDDDAKG